MITERQLWILGVIELHIASHGVPPSRAEIREVVRGCYTRLHQDIQALCEKGYLAKGKPYQARYLRVLQSAQDIIAELKARHATDTGASPSPKPAGKPAGKRTAKHAAHTTLASAA